MGARIVFFAYGCFAYLLFLATFLYAIAFIGGFGVPVVLDGPLTMPFVTALLIDAGLLGVFAVQHSVMARPWFKRWWTQMVPWSIERSTYVLFASLALDLLFWQWRPLGGVVWSIDTPWLRAMVWGLFAVGWLQVLVMTFYIDHFDLFGLRQVWLHLRGTPVHPRAIRDAGALPRRTPSAVSRIRDRVLGRADHVADTIRVCRGDDRLHPDCDPIRRERSGARARAVVRRIPPAHADAAAGTAATA